MSTEIRKRIAKVNNWLILNSGCTPYIVGFGMRQWTTGVAKRYPKYPLISFCGIRYTKKGSEAQFIADRDEYRNSAIKLFDHLDVLQKTYQDFCKDEKRFMQFVREIEVRGENYLHQHFFQFIDRYDAEYISSMASDGTLAYSDELIAEMTAKYPRHKKEVHRLTQMHGRSFFTEYQMDLLRVALQGKKRHISFRNVLSDMKLRQAVERVQKNFFWIKCNYKNVESITVNDILGDLHELFRLSSREITRRLKNLNKNVQRQRQAVRRIRAMKIFRINDLQKLFWLGKLAWMFDRRKKCNLLANYYIGRHLKWLSKRLNINEEKAFFLLPWEMDQVVAGKKRIEDFPIRERQKESAHFYDTGGHELFLLGKESRQIWEMVSPKVAKFQKEVKGIIAQKGVVRGTARVVMDAHNANTFRQGDILVTGMTRPDFISLMRKAAAFVTDEGGITCHAAIVAREMKKPCIIGTKIATKVLKDGDRVEVDANKGVVKILKKAFR